ncbi:MAG: hypothetical protein ACPGQL_08210 [Thermoplasmatota archaeon]
MNRRTLLAHVLVGSLLTATLLMAAPTTAHVCTEIANRSCGPCDDTEPHLHYTPYDQPGIKCFSPVGGIKFVEDLYDLVLWLLTSGAVEEIELFHLFEANLFPASAS